MEITKYSATGNTFIAVDTRQNSFDHQLIAPLCQQFECDGVLLLGDSDGADFKMGYYNSDGSLGEMCGNGGRAITLFASHCGVTPQSGSSYNFLTTNSRYQAELLEEGLIKIRMSELYDVDKYDLSFLNFSKSFYLNTGVPHAVLEVDDLESYDVFSNGQRIAHDPIFPEGSNVNFYQITAPNKLGIRTYERGVENETLSCGTGATATALAVAKEQGWKNSITLQTKGGELIVSFDAKHEEVYLCGKVEKIFSKQIDLG